MSGDAPRREGTEHELEVFKDDYSEASLEGTTISIVINTDGTPCLSYTGPRRANGICTPDAGSGPVVEGSALIRFFNAACPGDLFVHADEGGPVYLNGEEAQFTSFSESYFEAKGDGVTVSVTHMPDGSLDVSYTGPGRANGVCKIQ